MTNRVLISNSQLEEIGVFSFKKESMFSTKKAENILPSVSIVNSFSHISGCNTLYPFGVSFSKRLIHTHQKQ
jgi:hypothetical protein